MWCLGLCHAYGFEVKRMNIEIKDHDQLTYLWQLETSEKVKANSQDAYDLALQILEHAVAHNKWQGGRYTQNRIIQNVLNRLKMTKLEVIDPSSSHRFCTRGVMAFTLNNIGKSIIICPQSIQLDIDQLAQIIVHEAAHLVMGGNECLATQFEVIVMASSPTSIIHRNGYWEQCQTQAFVEKLRDL